MTDFQKKQLGLQWISLRQKCSSLLKRFEKDEITETETEHLIETILQNFFQQAKIYASSSSMPLSKQDAIESMLKLINPYSPVDFDYDLICRCVSSFC